MAPEEVLTKVAVVERLLLVGALPDRLVGALDLDPALHRDELTRAGELAVDQAGEEVEPAQGVLGSGQAGGVVLAFPVALGLFEQARRLVVLGAQPLGDSRASDLLLGGRGPTQHPFGPLGDRLVEEVPASPAAPSARRTRKATSPQRRSPSIGDDHPIELQPPR